MTTHLAKLARNQQVAQLVHRRVLWILIAPRVVNALGTREHFAHRRLAADRGAGRGVRCLVVSFVVGRRGELEVAEVCARVRLGGVEGVLEGRIKG